ncbi:hypothetical protein BY458DRAFT_536921 [Sporodiniella umbellata]|nr:hypothetical protein BY458DRAFT_536921 [Sporodiniella umbellata]
MMGYDFATFVNEYLKNQGHHPRTITKIDSNPEKSKHLETATTKIFKQEIDFCNLRTEVYDAESRIPSHVTYGTPKEDAFRRDLTINSLFYNVNKRLVEDLTGHGISDLIHGVIRTPLEPFITFRDDPLRVMRCIRFASRFQFKLTDDLCEAAKHPAIQEALIHKISRERIGSELEKMISGPHPLLALSLIDQLGLYAVVMQTPTEGQIQGNIASSRLGLKAVGAALWLKGDYLRFANPAERRLMVLSGSLFPFLGVTVETAKKTVPAVQLVLRDSIKSSNADINQVSTLFRGIPAIRELACRKEITRASLGMVIRDLGSLWHTAIKMAAVQELLDTFPDQPWVEQGPIQVTPAILQKYERLVQAATDFDITQCYQLKHLVDGRRASAILGLKPGPFLLELLNAQMAWQLENPQGSVEACEQAILDYWTNKQKN